MHMHQLMLNMKLMSILKYVDHIVFNSFDQLNKYKEKVQSLDKHVSIGLRVNPGYSEVETELYDPCALNSRLGIPFDQFRPDELDGVEGIHFHAMCEQNSDVLRTYPSTFRGKIRSIFTSDEMGKLWWWTSYYSTQIMM